MRSLDAGVVSESGLPARPTLLPVVHAVRQLRMATIAGLDARVEGARVIIAITA